MDWFLIGVIVGGGWIIGFCSLASFEFGKWLSRRRVWQVYQNGNLSDDQYVHLYHKLSKFGG